MPVVEKWVDIAGKWRVKWQFDLDNVAIFKFDHDPANAEVEAEADKYAEQIELTSEPTVSFRLDTELIKEVILLIKDNPSVTWIQWNAYLGTLIWNDAAQVRWFTYVLALELSARGNIDISAFTEQEVMSKLKTWIVNTALRKIQYIVLGE